MAESSKIICVKEVESISRVNLEHRHKIEFFRFSGLNLSKRKRGTITNIPEEDNQNDGDSSIDLNHVSKRCSNSFVAGVAPGFARRKG